MDEFRFGKKTDDLFKAILSLDSISEAEDFFRDLCTIDEIKAMSERWQIAKMIYRGLPYRKIADNLGVSTTTVSRVAVWVFHGENGYKAILDKLPKKSLNKVYKK